jgi:hypothetical protein
VLILTNPLLHILLLAPNIIRLPSLERGDEGGYGSVWDGVHLVMGATIFWTPLNLALYMPFRIFAYSSNILKTNFEASLAHGPSFWVKCSF